MLLEDVENKSIASSHHQAPTRPIPHLMDVECFSPDAAAKAAMATRLVLLSRGKGPRRLAAARFDDGRRAIGFVRARRPMTPTIGDDEDDSNGELAVACWCCSSCCGRMLTLFDPGPSGVGDKETGEAGLSSLGEKRKKEVDWFRLEFFFFFLPRRKRENFRLVRRRRRRLFPLLRKKKKLQPPQPLPRLSRIMQSLSASKSSFLASRPVASQRPRRVAPAR